MEQLVVVALEVTTKAHSEPWAELELEPELERGPEAWLELELGSGAWPAL